MPSVNDIAALALAARQLDRPLDAPAVLALAARLGGSAGDAPHLAPLLEQYLNMLEDSSLTGAFSEELAALLATSLAAAEKNSG